MKGVDAVYHFAALVGVGQSMYQINEYTDVNNRGTAVLLEALVETPVERLVVASSMSLYGEGLYRAPDGEIVQGQERSVEQLKRHDWEARDANGDALAAPAHSRIQNALPVVRLRAFQVRSGAALPDYRAGI